VEVVIAIGVFSFAIVAILSSMPTALNTMRDSANKTVFGRTFAGLTIEAAQLTDATSAQFLATFPRYYDVTGLPLDSAQGAISRADLTIRSATGTVSSAASPPTVHSKPMLVSPDRVLFLLFQISSLTGQGKDSRSMLISLDPN
jgi:uncharacterized protein (TIGR02598 family)